ncbi:uncharacterized protein LOC111592293 isoform X1 [Drosophila hydei]|uniref:Uncharacterized protein LOC111592293 isoform X1 n=1 Tax=Drosophila hydei TaxID=7224 RepID=A0A6J1L7Q8_DROHY|nr:uncharacterized protein LOC111592293 isoform X1 [Drosophila hydei]
MRNVALYIAHTPRRHNGAGMCMRLGLIKIALIWYNEQIFYGNLLAKQQVITIKAIALTGVEAAAAAAAAAEAGAGAEAEAIGNVTKSGLPIRHASSVKDGSAGSQIAGCVWPAKMKE